ncbi:MAG: hypothetical protein ACE5H5_06170 [Nitrospinota bacterium]
MAAAALDELTALPGIGQKKAEALRTAAIEMMEEVSEAEAPTAEAGPEPSDSQEAPPLGAAVEDRPEEEPTLSAEELFEREPAEEAEEEAPPAMPSMEEPAETLPPGEPPGADQEEDDSAG